MCRFHCAWYFETPSLPQPAVCIEGSSILVLATTELQRALGAVCWSLLPDVLTLLCILGMVVQKTQPFAWRG